MSRPRSFIILGTIASTLLPLVVIGAAMSVSTSALGALIHQWTFEEPDGTAAPQVLDTVGTKEGTFSNMDDTNRSSDVPLNGSTRSLSFNVGVTNNEKIDMAGADIFLNDRTDFSVAIWYRGTETQAGGGLPGPAIFGTNNGDYFATLGILGGKATYWHHNGGWQSFSSATTITNDAWHHIALVNHSNQTADLYVDGVAEITGASSVADNTNSPTDPYGFLIDEFMHLGNPNLFTKGKIDDARIYNHALTSTEVAQLAALVPEPASFQLTIVGMAAVGLIRRRVHWVRTRRSVPEVGSVARNKFQRELT